MTPYLVGGVIGCLLTILVLVGYRFSEFYPGNEKPEAAPRPKRRRGLVEMELTARGLLTGTRQATITLTIEEVERAGDLVRIDIVDMAGYSGVTLGQVRWVAPRWWPDSEIRWLDPASDSSS